VRADPMAHNGNPVEVNSKARRGQNGLAGNFIAPRAGFANPGQMNFALTPTSPARNIGAEPGIVNGWPARPTAQYIHPARTVPRPNDGRIDIGAYEFLAR